MKPAMIFPRADEATTLQRLALLIDAEWPSTGWERDAQAEAVDRHLHGDRAQAAADRLEPDVAEGLAGLADGLREAEASLDRVTR